MEQVVILMAAYQGEAFLREQLESILAQDYPDWKLVVRDDGSTDGTLPLIMEYSGRYPDKIYVSPGGGRQGAARNFLTLLHSCVYGQETGMDMPGSCTGRAMAGHAAKDSRDVQGQVYYMFADQDDVWHTDKISRTLKSMKRLEGKYGNNSPAMVFTDAAVVDENLHMIAPSFFAMQRLEVRKRGFAHLLVENLCIGCTMMMNRALAVQLKQVPWHARYHDWWMALMAVSMGHTSYLAKATMDYRQHGSNAVGSDTFASYVKKRCRSIMGQKASLAANYKQAEEFYRLYGAGLSRQCRQQLGQFMMLRHMKPVKRRITAFKGGYLKSGLVRNVGLLLVL